MEASQMNSWLGYQGGQPGDIIVRIFELYQTTIFWFTHDFILLN